MATRKTAAPFIGVDALKHAGDKRRNIPTAEYQSLMADEARQPVQVHYPRGTSNADHLKTEKQQQMAEQREFDNLEANRQRDMTRSALPGSGVSEAERALRGLQYDRARDQRLPVLILTARRIWKRWPRWRIAHCNSRRA